MLDTNARKYVQPMIQKFADACIAVHISANQVTIVALFIGLAASVFVYCGYPFLALTALWISGFLDAVDGSIAKTTQTKSAWGALIDLVFDRLVEMGILISLALLHQDSRLYIVFLLCAILFSMCVFLTVGALSKNDGDKCFQYQAGIMERTEGFIVFSLMIIFQEYLLAITMIATILIACTAIQRMLEAYKIFTNPKQ